jgi:hypothetical protein
MDFVYVNASREALGILLLTRRIEARGLGDGVRISHGKESSERF